MWSLSKWCQPCPIYYLCDTREEIRSSSCESPSNVTSRILPNHKAISRCRDLDQQVCPPLLKRSIYISQYPRPRNLRLSCMGNTCGERWVTSEWRVNAIDQSYLSIRTIKGSACVSDGYAKGNHGESRMTLFLILLAEKAVLGNHHGERMKSNLIRSTLARRYRIGLVGV